MLHEKDGLLLKMSSLVYDLKNQPQDKINNLFESF